MKTRRIMMAVAMILVCMSSTAQDKRVIAFQTVMAMHETTYKNFVKDGKYQEAIAPLTTLIHLIDTTNIYKVANVSEMMVRQLNAPYYYDLACCYAVTGQKTKVRTYRQQALKALEQAVTLGYNDYNNMLYDKDLTSLRKDKTYKSLLEKVKENTPLHVLGSRLHTPRIP